MSEHYYYRYVTRQHGSEIEVIESGSHEIICSTHNLTSALLIVDALNGEKNEEATAKV